MCIQIVQNRFKWRILTWQCQPSGANTASVNCFNGVVMSIKSSTTRSTKAPWILSLSSSNFCDNNLKKSRFCYFKKFKNQSRQKCHTLQLLGLEANCPVQSGTNLRVDEIASQLDYIAQEFLHVVHLEVLGQPESIIWLKYKYLRFESKAWLPFFLLRQSMR